MDTALPVDPVIEVDHVTEEGVAQNGTSSPTDSTEGTATRKKKLGAFSARRLQTEAATLKQSEVLEQQQALMQETREALARLSQGWPAQQSVCEVRFISAAHDPISTKAYMWLNKWSAGA